MSIPNNSIVQSPIPSVSLEAGDAQNLSAPLEKSDKKGAIPHSNVNFTALVLKIGSFMTGFQAIFTAGIALVEYMRAREFCSPISAATASELNATLEKMTSLFPEIKNIPGFGIESLANSSFDFYAKDIKLLVATSVVLATASIILMRAAAAKSQNSPIISPVK